MSTSKLRQGISVDQTPPVPRPMHKRSALHQRPGLPGQSAEGHQHSCHASHHLHRVQLHVALEPAERHVPSVQRHEAQLGRQHTCTTRASLPPNDAAHRARPQPARSEPVTDSTAGPSYRGCNRRCGAAALWCAGRTVAEASSARAATAAAPAPTHLRRTV